MIILGELLVRLINRNKGKKKMKHDFIKNSGVEILCFYYIKN